MRKKLNMNRRTGTKGELKAARIETNNDQVVFVQHNENTQIATLDYKKAGDAIVRVVMPDKSEHIMYITVDDNCIEII